MISSAPTPPSVRESILKLVLGENEELSIRTKNLKIPTPLNAVTGISVRFEKNESSTVSVLIGGPHTTSTINDHLLLLLPKMTL